MRLRLGLALLALAPLPLAGSPAHAATVEVERPAYLNIVVQSNGDSQDLQKPPTWSVQRLEATDGDTTLSPRVNCDTAFLPGQSFAVRCVPVQEPDPLPTSSGTVTVRGRRCMNAAVRATIDGPVPAEQVTGTITCGEPIAVAASCTATAGTPTTSGTFTGACTQVAPNGPLPIRCFVDLSRVRFDSWTVTCMGTDP
jgi:hypothetical protein